MTPSVVLMKSGEERVAMLNYDSLSEIMVLEENGVKLAILEEKMMLIDTVFINKKKFFIRDNKFFELIYDSKSDLSVEYKCKLKSTGQTGAYGIKSQTSSIDSYSSVPSKKGFYQELVIPDGYETKPYIYYWLNKNGVLNKFTNIKQLKKLYNNKKSLFKDYLKSHKVKYNNKESVVLLINYLETK